MKKLFLIALVATLFSMNVFAEEPATPTGETDTDCSRIVQGANGDASGSTTTGTTGTPSVENQ